MAFMMPSSTAQPVLAITGLPFHDLNDTFTQQDVALDRLFMDVAAYNTRVMGPSHVENVTELACRTAIAYHKVAHIAFPTDIQDMKAERKTASKRNITGHVSDVHADSGHFPNEADLRRAADVLNAGKKIAILAGQGALHATDALEQTAEILGAPIVKALLGKAAVPDDSPYTTGGIGLLGTKPSQEALERLRHAADRGHVLSLYRVHAEAGQSARGADRSRSVTHWLALSRRSRPGGRQPPHAARVAAAAQAQ